MITLIRYELKKIFSRRFVWVAAALGLALLLAGNGGMPLIRDKLGGKAQAIRDVYARFEGQTLTDAVAAQAQALLNEYVAAHPDEFEAVEWDEEWGEEAEGGMMYYAREDTSYAGGMQEACQTIAGGWTLEEMRENRERVRKMVETGLDSEGKPLSETYLQNLADDLTREIEPAIITYMEGYNQLFSAQEAINVLALLQTTSGRDYMAPHTTGAWALILTILVLASLFPAERTARMEPILLCAAGRRRMALAKMAAALTAGLGFYALIFGVQMLILGLTYGFDGFDAPARAMGAMWQDGTAGRAMLVYLAVSLAAALASAALAAWMSAVFRSSLPALLGGGLAVAAQVALFDLAAGYYLRNWSVYARLSLETKSLLRRIFSLLPAMTLGDNTGMYYFYGWSGALAAGCGWAALAAGLALWFAPRRWLRPRKS